MDSGRSRECDTCGERTGVYEVVMSKTEGKNHSEGLGVDKKII
jgi:transcriptional regulator NrdR family protein